uniref:DUF2569 family protein n=1 Tax=Vreelandella venusta TaxID=44935 RepID=UPI001555958D|nr:DUF2569 family protein [Halomonas hydrothermalis]
MQANDKFCNQCGELLEKSIPSRNIQEVDSVFEDKTSTNAIHETDIHREATEAGHEDNEHEPIKNEKKDKEIPYPNKPSGVGGFLKFFVIIGCIVGPILGLLSGFGEMSSTENEFPGLRDDEAWGDFKTIAYTSSFISMALLFWLASKLYESDLKSMKFKAIGVLWIVGPFRAIAEIITITIVLPTSMSGAIVPELFAGIFASGFVVTIWTLYFLLSKRVANTYWR